MMMLIMLLCLSGQPDCNEMNAKRVWRSETTAMQCQDLLPELVEYLRAGPLPAGTMYHLTCKEIDPKA